MPDDFLFLHDEAPVDDSVVSYSAGGGSPDASFAASTAGSRRFTPGKGANLGYAVGGSLLELLDQTVSSLSPVDPGTTRNMIAHSLEMPNLPTYIEQNKDAIAVGTGIASIVISELAFSKAAAAAKSASKGLGMTGFNRAATALDRSHEVAIRATQMATYGGARAGFMGADAITASTMVAGLGGAKMLDRGRLATKSRFLSAAKGGSHALGVEATNYAIASDNSFLYSDDLGTNLMWQALGVGLGAGAAVLQTNHILKRFANSNFIGRRTTYANDKARWTDLMDASALTGGNAAFAGRKGLEEGEATGDAITKNEMATAFLLRREGRMTQLNELKGSTNLTPQRSTQITTLNRLALEDQSAGFQYLEQSANQGVPGLQVSKLTSGSETLQTQVKNHIRYLGETDPAAFYGVRSMSVIPEGHTPVSWVGEVKTHFASRQQTLVQMLQDANAKPWKDPAAQLARVKKLQDDLNAVRLHAKAQPQLAVNGEFVPVDSFALVNRGQPFKVEMQTLGTSHGTQDFLWEAVDGSQKKTGIGIQSNGIIHWPKGKSSMTELAHEESQALFGAVNNLVDHYSKNGTFIVPANPTWVHLDAAEEIIRRSGNDTRVRFPPGMSKETAQIESLALKAEEMRAGLQAKGAQTQSAVVGGLMIPPTQASTATIALADMPDYMIRERFNLPQMSSYERALNPNTQASALQDLLRSVPDPALIRQSSLQELKRAVGDIKFAGQLFSETTDIADSLTGNSFRLGQDAAGKQARDIAPFLVWRTPMESDFFSKDYIELRLAARQTSRVTQLISPATSHQSVREMTNMLLADSDYRLASNTSELQEVGMTGALPGRGNSRVGTSFQYADTLFRESRVMLAAGRVYDKMNRASKQLFNNLFTPHADTFAALRSRANEVQAFQLQQYITARRGWDILPDPKGENVNIIVSNGKTQFVLKQSEQNRDHWMARFGKPMPGNALLPDAAGNPITLDELAFRGASAIHAMAAENLAMHNNLRRAKGLPELEELPYYVPPRDTVNKYSAVLMDGFNKTRYQIIADTEPQLRAQEKLLYTDPNSPLKKNPTWEYRSSKDVSKFDSNWDEAEREFMDPSIMITQKGERSNTSVSPFTEFDSIERSIAKLRAQTERMGRDLIEVVMENSIQQSKLRGAALRTDVKNSSSIRGQLLAKSEPTIHDQYVNALMGKNPLHDQGSVIGIGYNFIDGMFSRGLEKVSNSTFNARQWIKSASGSDYGSEFKRLESKIGNSLNFADMDAYVSQRFATRRVMDSQELTGRAAAFTATITLRMFESAQAVMNMAGNIAMMPGVMQGFTQRPGETIEQMARRLGYDAHIFTGANGKQLSAMNMGGIMSRAFSDTWNKTSHPEFDYMSSMGYITQEVAEFNKQFTQLNRSDDWTKWFTGNPSSKNPWERMGAVGFASALSDRSEDFTRAWAHMAGLRIADHAGLTGKEIRHQFAHDFANRTIANYSPTRRPEIFQGAVGNTLGLFQSYMWNYYGKMFRSIETKDYRQLATQMMMQQTMFGMQTVPGFQTYSDLVFGATDGDTDLNQAVYDKFGHGVADVLMTGLPSTIPMLMGAGDGLALYTRGDTNIRVPGAEGVPTLQIATKMYNAIGQAIDLFSESNPGFSKSQVAAVASQLVINRPLGGMIASFIGEGNVDARGNLLSRDTGSVIEGIARVMGLKTLTEAQETEAFYRNKQEQAMQLAKREDLLRMSRLALRDGKEDMLPQIFEQYLASGGDARNFNSWSRNLMRSAQETRTESQLRSVMNNPQKMDQVNRLLALRAGIDDEPEETLVVPDESVDPIQ